MQRVIVIAAVVAVAVLALWHPAPAPPSATSSARSESAPAARPLRAGHRRSATAGDAEVYVAGAVQRPGLYRIRDGERAGDAIDQAGGENPSAQPWAVNLAQRLRDGDEIYVPNQGERPATTSHRRRARASPPPHADVNRDDAVTLARVPGIGRALAQRIVELREREGAYASLDELLDVDGMTASRLERARPFLEPP